MSVLFVGALVIAFFQLPKIGEASEDGPRAASESLRPGALVSSSTSAPSGDRQLPGQLLQRVQHRRADRVPGRPVRGVLLGGAMVGRFIGSFFTLRRYQPSRVLAVHAAVAAALVVITMATNGSVAMWSVIAVGLFNSIMFPRSSRSGSMVWASTPERVQASCAWRSWVARSSP